MCQFICQHSFFNTLSDFSKELLRTMKKHLGVMIICNGMVQYNESLLAYYKLDHQRIDGHLFKNSFDCHICDSYPSGSLTMPKTLWPEA